MGWSTTVVVPPDGDMAAYMASLDKLRQRDDRIYYPAHGPAVTNPQQYVRHLLGHRMQREKQILRLVGEKPRAIPDIVANAYPGLDPRLVIAAGGSVLAHLVDLERRGLVEQQAGPMDSRLNKPLVLAMVAVALVLGVLLGITHGHRRPHLRRPNPKTIASVEPRIDARAEPADGLRRPLRVGGQQRTATARRLGQLEAHADPSRRRALRARPVASFSRAT